MNDAELYQNFNSLQKRDALLCLEEFGGTLKWKNCKERIIDIGCGDGSVTVNILKKYIPPNYKKIVGCDISEEMVKFANDNYSSDNIEFKVLDIGGILPDLWRNSFDYAFSFYALHWIMQQEVAFRNIYELLVEGGGCFLVVLCKNTVFDVYRRLARIDRWQHWLEDVERYVSPYHDSQEPEKKVKQMMETIGFRNIEIYRKHLTYTYESVDHFKNAMTALNVFKIPKELFNAYLEDMVSILNEINQSSNKEGLITATFQHSLLIISGNK